jgi:hypothetical protein
MQGSGWLSILNKISRQKHDNLAIVTSTGAEIVLREIVRVEDDFIIVRGRMAGSTDGGRVLILPFDQIAYLAFNKMLPEVEIHALFGQGSSAVQFKGQAAPVAASTEPAAAAQSAAAAAEGAAPPGAAQAPPSPGSAAPAAAAAAAKGPAKPGHPSKSVLLARLRARLANDSGGPLTR